MNRTIVGRLPHLLLLVFASSLACAGDDSWTSLQPEGGRPTQLLTEGSTTYLVSGTRIYSSANGGDTWALLSELPSSVSSIAVDGTEMFAGTFYSGVMRSQDAGASWKTVGLDHDDWREDLHVQAIAIGADAAKTIYAGTSEGLHLSKDGGETWTPVADPLQDREVFAIAVHPLNTDWAYAGTDDGVFCTVNAGASWDPCSYGLPADDFYASTVVIAPSAPYWVFTGSFNSSDVYMSDNNGATWADISEAPHNLTVSGTLRDIAVDPNDRYKAYAVFDSLGDDAHPLYLSTDGGSEWSAAAKPDADKYGPNASSVTVLEDGSLLVGTARGVYQAPSDGSDWTLSNTGFDNVAISNVAISPDGSGKMVAVGRNVYPYLSDDGGKTWQEVTTDLPHPDFYTVEFNPINSNELWLGQAFDEGLLKSINGGNNWTQPAVDLQPGPAIDVIAVDPLDPDHVIIIEATSRKIHVTWNGGASWSAATADIPPGSTANELLIDPNDSQIAYLATSAGLYKSEDGGETWDEIDVDAQEGQYIAGLAVDPVNSDVLHLSMEIGIYRSDDGGAAWELISNELTGGILAIDPADGSRLLLANFDGVYASVNSGESWHSFTGDLPPGVVSFQPTDVQFDPVVENRYYVVMGGVLYVRDGALPGTPAPDPDDEPDPDNGNGGDSGGGGGGGGPLGPWLIAALLSIGLLQRRFR